MTGRLVLATIVAWLLTGCATKPVRPAANIPVLLVGPPVAKVTTRSKPAKPADTAVTRCPTAADVRRLRAARPKPLRQQTMPTSPAERVARTAAQLGLYEARDAWADQVEEALARCER
ncbi:hypothetical protein ACFSGX_13540 [Sphingomonas arantia]|uniref:Lipoprotein n=1 Tax=Sphingomonas arantia TaxID=1460676 RepID=A0ABW4U3H9_9SPHN